MSDANPNETPQNRPQGRSKERPQERPKAPQPVYTVAPVEARQGNSKVNMLAVLVGSLLLAGIIWVTVALVF
ncbi:MAG: hypothetical protein KDJ29_07085 [Hyphomicrobiales bacterium]|nr:hypothetical protein [Hyphomicrobiales bacterium]